jgi:protein ImuB
MLWLALHFPRLPAMALGLDDPFAVVTDQHGAQRWLITGTPGIAAGTPWSAACVQEPRLRAHVRRPQAERAALHQLAWAVYRFGSPVCCAIEETGDVGAVPGFFLWLEVGASRRLFGGLGPLREQLCAELSALGVPAGLALAPTRAGAALLARAGAGVDAHGLDELKRRLGELSVATLPWPASRRAALWGVGLRHIGALLELPRDALARRFGAETLLDLDRLVGTAPEPFQALTPPPVFRRRFELSSEVEGVEGLLFPLRRLCLELQAYLRARDVAVRGLRLIATHARVAGTTIELRFTAPHRDGVRMFDMLRERLARDALPAAVRELHLHADEFSASEAPQSDLFAEHDALAWPPALERLAGRLGARAVWTPAPRDDHRPERAHARVRPRVATSAKTRTTDRGPARRDRPAWVLSEPQPLAVPPPAYPLPPPERIESGWWDGGDVIRDYYTLEREERRTWLYCDHTRGNWYVQGWWG